MRHPNSKPVILGVKLRYAVWAQRKPTAFRECGDSECGAWVAKSNPRKAIGMQVCASCAAALADRDPTEWMI